MASALIYSDLVRALDAFKSTFNVNDNEIVESLKEIYGEELNTYEKGYDAGNNDGYEQGFSEGLDEGREDGLDDVRQEGYDKGFHDGLKEAEERLGVTLPEKYS